MSGVVGEEVISSTVSADPLAVEDYLDYFEDISSVLLEYIVNMTDISFHMIRRLNDNIPRELRAIITRIKGVPDVPQRMPREGPPKRGLCYICPRKMDRKYAIMCSECNNTGNTAMHYAVSHGNFDVVSILLDSKVCNINRPNAAGYTCVMLVSLAEVFSQTHRQVVQRLFQLADVNIRAKQRTVSLEFSAHAIVSRYVSESRFAWFCNKMTGRAIEATKRKSHDMFGLPAQAELVIVF
uniref:ANK_REP_REGION domain-containing protein n=1 Tax=Timema monikensis TaxID=170555 RepID=A0A7R9EDS1_9NEOP|nr:unnamed protein product [Timema monikensis]